MSAAEMEISLNQAVGARRAYLWKELDFWLDVEVEPVNWDVICKPMIWKLLDNLIKLQAELYWKTKPARKNEVTAEMKDRAKAYPITSLIEFHKGKALAFCHVDKTPSLSYFAKKNIATCFVCNKRFDAIGVLVERDGMSYHDAIRALQC